MSPQKNNWQYYHDIYHDSYTQTQWLVCPFPYYEYGRTRKHACLPVSLFWRCFIDSWMCSQAILIWQRDYHPSILRSQVNTSVRKCGQTPSFVCSSKLGCPKNIGFPLGMTKISRINALMISGLLGLLFLETDKCSLQPNSLIVFDVFYPYIWWSPQLGRLSAAEVPRFFEQFLKSPYSHFIIHILVGYRSP